MEFIGFAFCLLALLYCTVGIWFAVFCGGPGTRMMSWRQLRWMLIPIAAVLFFWYVLIMHLPDSIINR